MIFFWKVSKKGKKEKVAKKRKIGEKRVRHLPLGGGFYVDAVLDHLCLTHGNNEDNNGQQIVQNGYLGYFWDVPGITITITTTTTMVDWEKAGEQ